MTLLELKNLIMFQCNNDAEDIGDYLPHITTYINEGYSLLVNAWCGERADADSDGYPPLRHDKSQPELPEWTHKAIADWATWLCYRNGNSNKQARGYRFREAAESIFSTLRSMSDEQKGITRSDSAKAGRYIYNIPR